MVNNSNNAWRLFWTVIHEWFCETFIRLYIIHTILVFRENNRSKSKRFLINRRRKKILASKSK
jgi:hypothetical protein